MSHGSFVTFGSPWKEDERSRFYRQQEAERRERELVARAAHWFANQLVGVSLTSLEQTHQMCSELATTIYGDRVATLATVIRKAAVLVWLATVERATVDPLPVAEVTSEPRVVLYHPAA